VVNAQIAASKFRRAPGPGKIRDGRDISSVHARIARTNIPHASGARYRFATDERPADARLRQLSGGFAPLHPPLEGQSPHIFLATLLLKFTPQSSPLAVWVRCKIFVCSRAFDSLDQIVDTCAVGQPQMMAAAVKLAVFRPTPYQAPHRVAKAPPPPPPPRDQVSRHWRQLPPDGPSRSLTSSARHAQNGQGRRVATSTCVHAMVSRVGRGGDGGALTPASTRQIGALPQSPKQPSPPFIATRGPATSPTRTTSRRTMPRPAHAGENRHFQERCPSPRIICLSSGATSKHFVGRGWRPCRLAASCVSIEIMSTLRTTRDRLRL